VELILDPAMIEVDGWQRGERRARERKLKTAAGGP